MNIHNSSYVLMYNNLVSRADTYALTFENKLKLAVLQSLKSR